MLKGLKSDRIESIRLETDCIDDNVVVVDGVGNDIVDIDFVFNYT